MVFFHREGVIGGKGRSKSAIASAAYLAGAKLWDAQTNRTVNYGNRKGVEHSEIIMPGHGEPPTRQELWEQATAAENRANSRTARTTILALPSELALELKIELVKQYAEKLANTYGVAVDFAIHSPSKKGNALNWHAHLQFTTRKTKSKNGRFALGEKVRELDKKEFLAWGKKTWLECLNQFLPEPINEKSNRTTPTRQYISFGRYYAEGLNKISKDFFCDPQENALVDLLCPVPTPQKQPEAKPQPKLRKRRDLGADL